MSEYKVPHQAKATCILAIVLFVTGIVIGNDAAIGSAVITLVVVGATTEILEAIHDLKHSK